jgi:hypothetical protein
VTEDEVRGLLAAAMAYDNRRPGDANVAAWLEAATRAHWTFDAALEAIHGHYATSTAFLMPGHITERIRVERRQPTPYRELGPAEPASVETRERMRDLISDHFAMPRDERKPLPRQEPA